MMRSLLAILWIGSGFTTAADRPDLIVADFEGERYAAGWKTTGTAFGNGPAKGTLSGQMAVTGFLGKGLVNSFRGGDDSTGTLTSPQFKLERKYLSFLIGGGQHPGKTCINLIVNGKTVRTATGPNDRPGGSERLDWHTWDVGELAGQKATLQIVDEQKGGWGHINVDHIVQSDRKKQAALVVREFAVNQSYLHLPVRTGAPMRRMKFRIGKDVVREFDIELAVDVKPDAWTFAEVDAFRGKNLLVECTLPADATLDAIKLAPDLPNAKSLYREKYRPLVHFTSRFGWLNDPNGLVFDGKEYHLFYQHNPFGVNWGNMHWGHAVSPDLMHWEELGIGLYPKKYGDWAFSGSAIVDTGNTSGWGTKEKPPLVLAYTSTARGECIAYSNDSGRTWTEYDQNPVVKHAGRDPKLLWYEPGKHWVMAVYDEFQAKRWIAFYTSQDLKKWSFASRIEGFFECPDLYSLPLDDNPAHGTKWVLSAADGKYLVGDFDGKAFQPDSKEKKQLWYGNFYAAQTFENAPMPGPNIGSGAINPPRPPRIQIGWASGTTFPGMPFNQQMTTPVALRLNNTSGGPRLSAWPYALNSDKISAAEIKIPGTRFGKDNKPRKGVYRLADKLDAFSVFAEIDVLDAETVGFDLRGAKLIVDVKKKTITCKGVSAPMLFTSPFNEHLPKRLVLNVVVDRGSVEVFADHGLVAMSVAALPEASNSAVELLWTGGEITVVQLKVERLKSAWPNH